MYPPLPTTHPYRHVSAYSLHPLVLLFTKENFFPAFTEFSDVYFLAHLGSAGLEPYLGKEFRGPSEVNPRRRGD